MPIELIPIWLRIVFFMFASPGTELMKNKARTNLLFPKYPFRGCCWLSKVLQQPKPFKIILCVFVCIRRRRRKSWPVLGRTRMSTRVEENAGRWYFGTTESNSRREGCAGCSNVNKHNSLRARSLRSRTDKWFCLQWFLSKELCIHIYR